MNLLGRIKRNYLVLIGYISIVVLVFGRALVPGADEMIFGDDIHRQYYFYREFFNTFLAQGIFPWWNPYLFGGEPFIANPVVNIWYPPTWLFSLLPLNIAYAWHLALHVFWAMLGMYLLLRSVSNTTVYISNVAAWVGGVVFGLSGFFMARTFAGHVDVIAAASWMPWVVRAFFLLMRVSSDASRTRMTQYFAIASGVFAMQLLAGYQTMAFFTVIAVGVFAIARSILQRNLRSMLLCVAAGMVGVGLAAIQILPVQEFFGRSIRLYPFPYSWHAYGSLEWRSLLQFFHPFLFGDQHTYAGPPPNFIEHSAFVGIGGLVLGLMGVFFLFQKKVHFSFRLAGLVFFSIVFFGIWVSLGPNAPFDLQKLLWQTVPMYHYLRIPPRHLILVVFGLAGLAAVGLGGIRKSWISRAVGFVVVVELILWGRGFIEIKPLPAVRHDTEFISLLKRDTHPYRLLQNFGVWVAPRDSLDFDSVMSYGISSATGYDPSILRSYYEFVEALNKSTTPGVLDHDVQVPYMDIRSPYISFLGIRYLMVPPAHDPLGGQEEVPWVLVRYDRDRQYRLYENMQVYERFFFVPQAEFFALREPIVEKLRQGADLSKTVLIRDPKQHERTDILPCKTEAATTEVLSYTPNVVTVSVDTPCDAYLSSSEIHYPGWRAYIDGKESTIYESNIAFRTLFVPAGKHTIVYRYVPTIFLLGGVLSLVTMLGLYILLRKSKP